MKQYKAIFFDWDGTAVVSRKASAQDAVKEMKKLLAKGIKLAIISGTTYDNIAGGSIEEYFTKEELANLYLGLGRGAFNYKFEEKKPVVFNHRIPKKKDLLVIHDICYQIHRELWERYDFMTDVVFCRPNYCKIDIMVENNRGVNLFMQENELDTLRESLKRHGITGGLQELIHLAQEVGNQFHVKVSATCDAKYLEVGISDKSDNANLIMEELQEKYGICPEECSFWGDEFVGLEEGIFGSDSFMCTEKTCKGDFFDVSEVAGERPKRVQTIGGGVATFLRFLEEQGNC